MMDGQFLPHPSSSGRVNQLSLVQVGDWIRGHHFVLQFLARNFTVAPFMAGCFRTEVGVWPA
jgi:hypothetical protein